MKKTPKLFTVLAFFILTITACSPKEKEEETLDMEEVKSEIQALEDAYAEGEKAMDPAAVAVYYSKDAISYSRNRQPLKGREAIQENIAANMANDTLGNYNVYKIEDLFAEGDVVVEVGSWTELDADGTELQNGYYMSYFEKRDGQYVCVRDMSTTTAPVKSAM